MNPSNFIRDAQLDLHEADSHLIGAELVGTTVFHKTHREYLKLALESLTNARRRIEAATKTLEKCVHGDAALPDAYQLSKR